MTGRPAVQHDHLAAFTGNLDMIFAVVGKEVRHGFDRVGKPKV